MAKRTRDRAIERIAALNGIDLNWPLSEKDLFFLLTEYEKEADNG